MIDLNSSNVADPATHTVAIDGTTFSALISEASGKKVVTLQPSEVSGGKQTLIAQSKGAEIAKFEKLLDAISFNNSSNGTLSEDARALTIDVTDTGGASTAVAANVAITVTAVNDTPVIDNAQLIIEEGTGNNLLTVTMTDYDNGGEIVGKSDLDWYIYIYSNINWRAF